MAMYTMLNPLEEACGQALTLTKSLDFVEGVYTKLAAGLKEHGHRPTQLMYTDNAQAELSFHERITHSLQDNASHIIINPSEHLAQLSIPSDYYSAHYEAADLIDAACYHLLSEVAESDQKIMIGFALFCSDHHNAQSSVDTIQIATADAVYLFKVGD